MQVGQNLQHYFLFLLPIDGHDVAPVIKQFTMDPPGLTRSCTSAGSLMAVPTRLSRRWCGFAAVLSLCASSCNAGMHTVRCGVAAML